MRIYTLKLYIFPCCSWDYEILEGVSPIYAGMFYISFLLIGIYLLLNMFIAILNGAIAQVSMAFIAQLNSVDRANAY